VPSQDWTPYDLVTRGQALLYRPWTARIDPDLNREEALRCFEHALTRAPDLIGAKLGVALVLLLNVANGHTLEGGPDEVRAEQLLTDVLSINDNSAFARMLMGLLRQQQLRLNDSLIELRVATGLAPSLTWAIPHLGLTLAFLGQPSEALPLIEKSLQSAEQDFLTPLFHFTQGLCYLLLGNTEKAIPSFRTAQVLNPRVYQFFFWLAAALGLQGELNEAHAALRHAIEMSPNIVSRTVVWLLGACPEFISLYERTAYVGLRRAGLPDIWAETNARPAGWINLTDQKANKNSAS
jgi:adenylate cyclase